ncbi:MAG TPA: S53 family peptidase [Mycobacteriales bacterium]|nr:S53 family peptidase [Mycobacteriales bacterium]
MSLRRLVPLFLLPATLLAIPSPPAGAATSTQVAVCKRAPHGRVGCFAIRLDRYTSTGRVRHATTPVGLTPTDLTSAYSLPASPAGAGMTVAIVDAYDDPQAEHDLATYRSQFGLPACTTANGCFRKVSQSGGRSYPAPDPGWSQEMSLDLDMVSAVCPACHILLVEATSSSQANLGAAVNTAVRLGADAVSNSYGGPDASDGTYGRYYHHAGVAITASSGDSGYGVSYPASSKWVTAVGGTSLHRSSRARRGWSESVWSGSGSGCSTLNSTTWQPASTTGCDGRAMADIAAVADPATGVAVYDSYVFENTSGWLTFGGTSAASPIIAAVFALAGNSADVTDGSFVWRHHRGSVNDITYGSNGSCPTARWCNAHYGWDGPTGWGTPKGVGAF